MGKINESVCEKNLCQQKSRKTKAIIIFSKKYFWKFIRSILLVVTYGKKGYILWGESHRYDKGKKTWIINRDVSGKTDLQRVIFILYC